MSARERSARWQRLAVWLGAMAMLLALVLAPVQTIWAVTLTLALLFVAVIGFRLVAAYGLCRATADGDDSSGPRVPDHLLPIYSVLVPLYREAHMLPSLVAALRRLDYPALGSKGTKLMCIIDDQ